MNQFYAPAGQISQTSIELTGQEAKHASKVLRKKEGEEIYITDGEGKRFRGVIESVNKSRVVAGIKEVQTFSYPNIPVVLVMGLIKKRDRLEFAVEKAVELGVSEMILFKGDHSETFKVRMDRVEASAVSAMKQSLRVFLPSVKLMESLDDVIKNESDDTIFVNADQEGETDNFKINNRCSRLVMIVGPEGGLSERENTILRKAGAVGLRLGDYRLRAETAAMVMALRYGNLRSDVKASP